jgi:hypothetical protein
MINLGTMSRILFFIENGKPSSGAFTSIWNNIALLWKHVLVRDSWEMIFVRPLGPIRDWAMIT